MSDLSEYDLPDWFWRHSELSMDALRGPDEQYRAGARDMLAVVATRLEERVDHAVRVILGDDQHKDEADLWRDDVRAALRAALGQEEAA